MKARFIAAFAALLCVSACSSTPQQSLPRFDPPPAGAAAAEILSQGNVATATAHVFSGADGLVATVDGAEAPSGASSVRITPGTHRIGINCLLRSWWLGSNLQHAVVSGSFMAGQKYYVRCALENEKPRAWLADTPDGLALPRGFEAIQ